MRMIDAEKAKDMIKNHRSDFSTEHDYRTARVCVNATPSAEPERKKGKWIGGKCNQCGGLAPFWPMASTYFESDFCPHCGSYNGGISDE